MFKTFCIIMFSLVLPVSRLHCQTLEKELGHRLEEFSPIKQEKEAIQREQEGLKNKVAEHNKKHQKWGEKIVPLIQDIIKDSRLDTQSKVALIKKFFTATDSDPNKIFVTIRKNDFIFNSYEIEKSFFSFVVSYIVENDARKCPIDLIQALMAIGAKPGSESPIFAPTTSFVMNKDQTEDAHCVVKETLKNSKNDTCKSCAQKIDELFNEYKRIKDLTPQKK